MKSLNHTDIDNAVIESTLHTGLTILHRLEAQSKPLIRLYRDKSAIDQYIAEIK